MGKKNKKYKLLDHYFMVSATPKKIKNILNSGIDVNAKDENGWTALMFAIGDRNNPEVIELLLKAGAKVNAKTKDDVTALMLAVSYSYNNSKIVKLLLEHGADINAKDKDGDTALMLAKLYNNKPIIIELLEVYQRF